MSFHNNNLWMPRDPAFLPDGERDLRTSTNINQKRQPLFDDTHEKELFCSRKKQAVDSIPPSSSNVKSTSNHFNERLLVSESFRSAGDNTRRLSMEDHLCLNNGIGRSNMNEIVNSENSFPILMVGGGGGVRSYITAGDNREKKDNSFTFQPAYRKEDGSCTLNNCLTSSLPYNTGQENFIMGAPLFGKNTETLKWDALTTSLLSNCKDNVNNPFSTRVPDNVNPFSTRGVPHDMGSSMNQSHDDAGGTIISFALEGKDCTGGGGGGGGGVINSSLDTAPHPPEPGMKQVPKTGASVSKTKETIKSPVNNFPSNVKSFLSTGILDGVPVKYVALSKEISLRGVIKGTGYLCDCNNCKFSKVVNAYEFERHAGCKTKHPNNHIYFENGKTIYSVVQELKTTPQELLFEVIHNVTGSPINQNNFRIWKVSYEAAIRELDRIYGKEKDSSDR